MADEQQDEGGGIPEWVVTFGDMMSLLLTFFIMLVSLSEIANEKKYRAILDALQQYTGYRTSPAAPAGESFPLNSLVEQLQTLGSFTDRDNGHGGVKTRALEGPDVRVYRTREGNSLQIGEPLHFAAGSVELSDEARRRLHDIASEIAGKPNKIELRGHAAPEPLSETAAVADKTRLSYERARNVLRYLEELGVDHARLRVAAVADLEPLPESGDESSQKHDRVQVVMLDVFSDELVGPEVVPD